MHAANSENEALAAVSATQTSALETAWSKRMAGFFSPALQGHQVMPGTVLLPVPCEVLFFRPERAPCDARNRAVTRTLRGSFLPP